MKILKDIKNRLANISFRTRLAGSFIILIIMSLSILGIGYYYKSSDVILSNAGENILGMVKQSNEALNSRFIAVEDSAIIMHIDEELFNFFSKVNLNDQNLCLENDKKITRILLKYFPFSEDIYSVNIVTKQFSFGQNPNFWIPKSNFSNSRVYKTGLGAINKLTWIGTYDLLEEFNIREKEKLKLAGQSQYIFSAARLLNCSTVKDNMLESMPKMLERPVLVINYKEKILKKAFKASTYLEGSSYYVLNENGEILSSSDSAKQLLFNETPWLKSAFERKSGKEYVYINGKKMLACFDTINANGWISVVFTPYDKLLKTLPNMLSYTVYLTIFIIGIAVAVASFVSERITRPIKRLLSAIKRMGEGKFDSRIKEVGNGEFTYLIHKFNDMNERIQKLIDENYHVKVKEIEAELKALNFQFNPHFIYNTLNIINWMCIENHQIETSEMLIDLSEMLEYTANNGLGVVKFEDDVKYLKNYVGIMTKRFIRKFTLQYDIDPKLYNYDVPKFFLQPFIENSLIHGFEEIEEGGTIKISGWIEENKRFFCIEDNGNGMENEKINEILKIEEESIGVYKSIGIDNVNKRVKLIYGKTFGVQIESQLHIGTKVTITLPLC